MTGAMARFARVASREELVHQYAGGFVVAQRHDLNLYRGVSTGKPVVTGSREVSVYQGKPRGYDLVSFEFLRVEGKKTVYRVKEKGGDVGAKGEEIQGTLGQVAEGGCWYETREEAEQAAKRWRIVKA